MNEIQKLSERLPAMNEIQKLTERLPGLVDKKMRIWIQDQAEDAEPQAAPMVERPLAKWEISEEGEHVRLYFNPCHFLAIPIASGSVTLKSEAEEVLLTAEDGRGKLLYKVLFSEQ
ncbi:hypothetical protein [Brevibacillus centrosporus]|uniref:hypothetical protein n=1 Tax=Brevibacillus centrosporus TaxID=54910 RepID=UPI002E1ADA71|nr:hypothetical protein [Brevibacillus centrosporus]